MSTLAFEELHEALELAPLFLCNRKWQQTAPSHSQHSRDDYAYAWLSRGIRQQALLRDMSLLRGFRGTYDPRVKRGALEEIETLLL